MKRNILFVSSEVRPFAMSGGLGDVLGVLPRVLAELGHDVRVVMPLYRKVPRAGLQDLNLSLGVPTGVGERWCGVRMTHLPQSKVPVYFLEHDALYDRDGFYGTPDYPWWDNCLRFTVLSRGALQLCHALKWYPDVINANDWQTALVPAYLNVLEKSSPLHRAASVFTIHNLGYQGRFPAPQFGVTGLPWELFTFLDFEFWDEVNLLKGALTHSTLLSTVSPGYAREIQTPAYGEGLDALLRERAGDLHGILNGIDLVEWDPATDPHIPHHFSAADPSGKGLCKAALQRELGLPVRDDIPLVGIVTRFAWQKGIDVLAEVMPRLLALPMQMVVVGSGEAWAEKFFGDLQAEFPGNYRGIIQFNTGLAHRVEAGADLYLMPSRYEPCGLNQMYSLRYGALPIVRATGGLDDTVENFDPVSGRGTGFKFWDMDAPALEGTVSWAVNTFRARPHDIAAMRRRAMEQDFSWKQAARKYMDMYERAIAMRRMQVGG